MAVMRALFYLNLIDKSPIPTIGSRMVIRARIRLRAIYRLLFRSKPAIIKTPLNNFTDLIP